MEPREATQLVTIVLRTDDLLSDLRAAGPSLVVPPGLWNPLDAALRDLGSARSVLVFDAGSDSAPAVDSSGYPMVTAATGPHPNQEDPALERAVRQFVKDASQPPDGSDRQGMFERDLRQHGLTGLQLQIKAQVVDFGYEDYAAHGRLPSVPKDRPRWLRNAARRLRRALGPCRTAVDSMSKLPGLSMLAAVPEAIEIADHVLGFGSDQTDQPSS